MPPLTALAPLQMPRPAWMTIGAYAAFMGSSLVWRMFKAEQAADELLKSAAQRKAADLNNSTGPSEW